MIKIPNVSDIDFLELGIYLRFGISLFGEPKRSIMPIYEYQCAKCRHEFEKLVFGSNPEVFCPKCGSGETEKRLSKFGMGRSSDGSGGGSGCGGCSSSSCAGCK